MKKLEKFNCAVTVIEGGLQRCNMAADGGPEFVAGSLNWQPVRAPVTQDFLDAVNEALGTKFTVEDFPQKSHARKK